MVVDGFVRAAESNGLRSALAPGAFSPLVAADLRSRCEHTLRPPGLEECYMQLSCEETALQSQ